MFVHLLLTANWADGECKGVPLKRGQRLVTLKELAAETGLSVQNVRTALKHLELTRELTTELTTNQHKITVEKYEFYQGGQQETNNESNNDTNNSTNYIRIIKNTKNIKKVSVSNKYIYKYYGYRQNVALTDKQYAHLLSTYRNTEILIHKVSSIISQSDYPDSTHYKLCCKVGDEDGYREVKQ